MDIVWVFTLLSLNVRESSADPLRPKTNNAPGVPGRCGFASGFGRDRILCAVMSVGVAQPMLRSGVARPYFG